MKRVPAALAVFCIAACRPAPRTSGQGADAALPALPAPGAHTEPRHVPRTIPSGSPLPDPWNGYRWCKVRPGLLREVALPQTCAEAGYADVSPATAPAPPPPPVQCRDRLGQLIVLSGGQSCAANGYAEDGAARRRRGQ